MSNDGGEFDEEEENPPTTPIEMTSKNHDHDGKNSEDECDCPKNEDRFHKT